ncbi:MAG: ribonuclease D, partial [Rhodoglobus sp.]|nr:ribonuclease D [Rhodoglobus sp.]
MTEYSVISDAGEFRAACAVLAAGTGPVAVDVERASGFRYSQRAYLVQVFRRDAG